MVTRVARNNVGGRMFSSWLKGNMVVYPEGLGPATAFFVDGTKGAAGNDGLSWERSFNTITLGMTAVGNLGARGRGVIFVAPAGYTEDIVTPLNADGPFGQLIAVNPTPGNSFGAAWITASTAGAACLTVRARGWYIEGFEFDALADAACVILGGTTTGNNAAGTLLEGNLFVGQNQGLVGVDWQSNSAGNPHVTIRSNGF